MPFARQPNLHRATLDTKKLVEAAGIVDDGRVFESFTNKERQRRQQRKEARAAKKGRRGGQVGSEAAPLQSAKKKTEKQRKEMKRSTAQRSGDAGSGGDAEGEGTLAKKAKKKKKKKKLSMTERRQRQAEARGKASVTQAPSRDLQGKNAPFFRMLQEANLIESADGEAQAQPEMDEDDREIAEMERLLGISGKNKVGDEDIDYILNYKEEADEDEIEDDDPEASELARYRADKARRRAQQGKKREEVGSDDAMSADESDDGISGDADFAALDASVRVAHESESEGDNAADDGDDLSEDDSDESDARDDDAADEDMAAVNAKAQPLADAYLSRKGIYGDNDVPTQRLKRRPPTGDSSAASDSAPATAATALSASAPATGGSRYVPPALRRAAASGSTAEASAAQSSTGRLARGLLNRLNESNLASIAGELEMLFMRNSRNTMTSLLTDFVIDVCVGSNRMLAHLLRVYAACVAALHTLVGMEVGASFTQTVVQRLHAEHATQLQRIATVAPGDVEAETEVALDKRCLNMASLVALLYHFKVVHSSLICELLIFFTETLTPVDAELVLEILRTCGAKLRQDDPLALKTVLDAVRAKARVSAEQSGSARMRFLLESIEDLRSNRCRILKDNRGALEPLVKALRATVRGKGSDASGPLKIPLKDLLDASNRGRWWLVGAAWSGRGNDEGADEVYRQPASEIPLDQDLAKITSQPSVDLVKLAAKQRMNTDIRRKIFYVIMSSEDYVDAVDKLMRLKLKGKQEREIVRVLLDCCVQQRIYNPYFSLVARKLCTRHGNHRLTLQYSVWDRFKTLHESSVASSAHLMRFLAEMIAEDILSLTVFKNLDFSQLDKALVFPLQLFFAHFLTHFSEDTVDAAFERLAKNKNAAQLKDGMLLFLKFYCRDLTTGVHVAKVKGQPSEESRVATMRERIKVAKRACGRVESLFADEL